MNNEELRSKWMKRISGTVLDIEKIESVPEQGCHPFVIGTRHVAYASDNCGGILSQDVCEKIPCDHCKKPYSDGVHKTLKACYIKVNTPCTQKQVSEILFPIKDEMEQDGIQGFAFLNHKMITDWE